MCQAGGLCSDALKHIIDKAVHDAHRSARDTGVWVHLFHHLVDVDAIALLAAATSFLVGASRVLGITGFLLSFSTNFLRHGGWRRFS